eukprot:scaffold467977_cov28-Prasinocladus_malaysianus.AAC.1
MHRGTEQWDSVDGAPTLAALSEQTEQCVVDVSMIGWTSSAEPNGVHLHSLPIRTGTGTND